MLTDYHVPAFYTAGLAVYALRRFEPLATLDVTDPDAVLAQVRKDIDDALAAFGAATTPQQRRDSDVQLTSVFVGVISQRQGATAMNREWNEITTPAFQRVALQRCARDGRLFVSNHWSHIRRLARTLAAEKTLPVGQAAWLLAAGKGAPLNSYPVGLSKQLRRGGSYMKEPVSGVRQAPRSCRKHGHPRSNFKRWQPLRRGV
jgi:hypothetical protein